MTDAGGLYEHADGDAPRPEHGYCVDDVARALVVLSREKRIGHSDGSAQDDLFAGYLDFVLAAQVKDGRFRNRRDHLLRWNGWPGVEDCWGRGLWALGTVVGVGADEDGRALAAFDCSVQWRPSWVQSTAFAALGALDLLRALPDHGGARALLADAAALIGPPAPDPHWPWPTERLEYASAVLPEVLIGAGVALGVPRLLDEGLQLLGWLLDVQTRSGHLSVVPVGGRGPLDQAPGFDQQPIEVAALADACAQAHAATGDQRWADGVATAVAWFHGDNDSRTVMFDAATGAGYDGLELNGRNENQGAESTLAMLSTFQWTRALDRCAR